MNRKRISKWITHNAIGTPMTITCVLSNISLIKKVFNLSSDYTDPWNNYHQFTTRFLQYVTSLHQINIQGIWGTKSYKQEIQLNNLSK